MPTIPHSENVEVEQTTNLILMQGSRLENGPIPEDQWKPGKKEYAVMITLAIVSLMVALDATILVSVLPALAVDLNGTANDAFWAGTSYLLSCAVCQPFIAALSDIFGRKEMLVSSVFLFTLGTILCAPIAKNFPVFFVGRSIQGIGGGGIITMGQVIFADIVPLRQRPKYFSFVLGAWALGSVLGPLIGGLFVEHATWAWCFYLNFPFCAIGLVLIPIYVKLTTSKSSLMSKLSRVDWVGGFFFIGGMTSFLIGISWAGIQFAWRSAQTIAPMVIGIIAVLVSVIWEKHGAQEPFLRPSLFHSVSALATYACALFQGFILFCALYYIPFFFTAIRFKSPTNSGLDIFPVTCFLLPSSIIISLVTTRIGRYRWAIWGGWVITSAGCGLLVLFDTHTRTVIWAVILAVFGIGHGMLLTSVNVGIQAVSHVEDAGRAAAMYAFMRTLGMAIGVAIGGTVFQNVMNKKLDKLGLPADIAHNAEAYVKKLAQMDPNDPQRVATISGYLAGFHGVYWTITGASIASFVISLIIRGNSMDKLFEAKFRLKGARNPLPPTTGATSAPAVPGGHSQTETTTDNNPQQNSNSSLIHSRAASTHGTENTYAGSTASRDTQGDKKREEDSTESMGTALKDSQGGKKEGGKSDGTPFVSQTTSRDEKREDTEAKSPNLRPNSSTPATPESPDANNACATPKDPPREQPQEPDGPKPSLDSTSEETEAVVCYMEPAGQIVVADMPSGRWPESPSGTRRESGEEGKEEEKDGGKPTGQGESQSGA